MADADRILAWPPLLRPLVSRKLDGRLRHAIQHGMQTYYRT